MQNSNYLGACGHSAHAHDAGPSDDQPGDGQPGGPGGGPGARQAAAALPPEALQYAMARLAIDFVSGPGALASVLRTGLLPAPCNGAPCNGKSVPIEVGYASSSACIAAPGQDGPA